VYEDEPPCMYRADDGGKCAVGCLIPDDLYRVTMEGSNIRALGRNHSEIAELFEDVEMSVMERMQRIHDDQPVEAWEASFQQLAEDYILTVPRLSASSPISEPTP
jgi:hypothetical protein